MRVRLLVCVLAVLFVLVVCCGVWADDAKNAPLKSKVLFLVGGPFHDNPKLFPILQNLLEGTGSFTVTITRSVDDFNSANLKQYDLVICYCTQLKMTEEQGQALLDFVENGKGLMGIHAGATDTFHGSEAYWKLAGAKFRTHGHETFKVNITGKSHPAVKGMSSFEINDETYSDDFNPASKVIVLARRDKDSEPSVWIQYFGKGRVWMTGLGHDKQAWDNPAFQELVKRGAEWATFRLNP